jgi:hypothetical protein
MKKIYYLTAVLFVLSFSGLTAQIEKGNIIIDTYYGAPNLITGLLKSAVSGSNSTNVSVGSLGPLGARVLYMVGERVDLGLDVNYANSSVTGIGTNSNTGLPYSYTVSLPRVRVMGAFDYHIALTENFNFYYMVHVGYGNWSYNTSSSDPTYVPSKITYSIPIAFRTGVGARYYFTKNIGLNADFGFFGGGLIQGGVSAKF